MLQIKNIEALLALSKDESKKLGLIIGAQKVTPGQYIPKGEAQSAPGLSFNGAVETYFVIGIDLDAPFPSFSFLGPILHWIQPGLTPVKGADSTTKLVAGDEPFIADYAGPGPPPQSSPHRYIFLLYEQPEGLDPAQFALPGRNKVGIWPRIRYDLQAFEKEAGLGPVVASNYFLSN